MYKIFSPNTLDYILNFELFLTVKAFKIYNLEQKQAATQAETPNTRTIYMGEAGASQHCGYIWERRVQRSQPCYIYGSGRHTRPPTLYKRQRQAFHAHLRPINKLKGTRYICRRIFKNRNNTRTTFVH